MYLTRTVRVHGRNPETREFEDQDVTVSIEMDQEAILFDLATKAARAKTKRSTALGGYIKVKVTSRKAV